MRARSKTTDDAKIRPLFNFELLEPRVLFNASAILTATTTGPPVAVAPPILTQPPVSVTPLPANGLNGSSPLSMLDNRQHFAGIAAKFTDDHAADASAYSATIDWGDGSSIQKANVFSDPAGGFDVLGSHTYVFGTYNAVITITAPGVNAGDDPRTLVINQRINVFPPPTACEAYPINAINGQAFRGTIATYTGIDATQLDRYSATVYWGDGQQSAGQLQLNSDGSLSVIGQHAYAHPGFDDVQVVLTANGAASDVAASMAFCRATVANGFGDGAILDVPVESGVRFDGNLASFQFLGPNHDISHLRAEVVLTETGGDPITISGTIIATDNGFDVSANILCTQDYRESIQVRIYDSTAPANPALGDGQQLVGLARGTLDVAQHLRFTPIGAEMTAGVESRVLVGHFTSDDPGHLWNKTFEAMIDWGDGSDPSMGQVVPTADGGYDVYGTHTYPIIGCANGYCFGVRVTETRSANSSATPAGPFTYAIWGGTDPRTGYPVITVAAGSFAGFYMFPRNYHIDTDRGIVWTNVYTGVDLSPSVSDILASVQWSDGVTSSPQITQVGPNQFSVQAIRTDLPPGQYSAVLSVTIGKYQKTANFRGYIVGNWDLNARVTSVPAHVFVGDHFHGVIATFTVPGPAEPPGSYSVYLYIPGATNLTTTLVANSDGSFSVVADFDAMNPSSEYIDRNPAITIYRGEQYTQAPLSVNLTRDPTRVTLTPDNSLHFRQRQLFTTTVATFTAPSADDTPGDFTAQIDWGDGHVTTGAITEQYNGVFDITGSYGYVHNSGYVPLKITVTDSAGKSIFTYSSMQLDPDPVAITPGTPSISTGTVSGNLANFIDEKGESTNPAQYRVYHAALIDWGDGDVTSGLVTTNPDGTYSVASTHDYQADGDYQIHILVRRNVFYAWMPPRLIAVNWGETVAMDASASSTITADPNSDFGVTFYVHVVGVADREAQPPASAPVLPTVQSAAPRASTNQMLFSKAAISPVNNRLDPITISSSTTSWLASDLALPGSGQSSADSPVNTLLI